jgi:hypothetical protein
VNLAGAARFKIQLFESHRHLIADGLQLVQFPLSSFEVGRFLCALRKFFRKASLPVFKLFDSLLDRFLLRGIGILTCGEGAL